MSLKGIDLQFAIHKNDDVGFKQQQLLHKPEVDQSALGQANVKDAERNRMKSAQVDGTESAHIRDDGKRKQKEQHMSNKKANSDMPDHSPEKAEHPYKGRHIDLLL
jgi:hypothetical protein